MCHNIPVCFSFFFECFALRTDLLFPEFPRKKRMDFLIAERRDERKAVRAQDIRDIKGLKQRVLSAWDIHSYNSPFDSRMDSIINIIYFSFLRRKDFSVRTVDTTSTFQFYFFQFFIVLFLNLKQSSVVPCRASFLSLSLHLFLCFYFTSSMLNMVNEEDVGFLKTILSVVES